MRRIIICCEVLKNELRMALEDSGMELPVIYIPMELHTYPEKLRVELQRQIVQFNGYDQILMVFGCCGNALIDLEATKADLIIPKVDDCIQMLLCQEGNQFDREKSTYFLSEGWLRCEKGIFNEHERMVTKYGESRANRILLRMLNEYKYLMFIDTGITNQTKLKQMLEKSQQYAAMANLELTINKGNIWLLKKLVQNQIDQNFITVKKGDKVKLDTFRNLLTEQY